jgi:tRNA pseudouridine38-40 synthase
MRYFIEFAYKGTEFNGLAKQSVGNVITVQQEIDKALSIITKTDINSTTSSRTDAGVHALQNYMHFDSDFEFNAKSIYQLNAIIHADIVIKSLRTVQAEAHSRFDASFRRYRYDISITKNPFNAQTAWYLPIKFDVEQLHHTANIIKQHHIFESFCKKHTDVFTYECDIQHSEWTIDQAEQKISYTVQANRFLRGMVRALVATQIQVARGNMTIQAFEELFTNFDNSKTDFSAPAHGLCLLEVAFPTAVWLQNN